MSAISDISKANQKIERILNFLTRTAVDLEMLGAPGPARNIREAINGIRKEVRRINDAVQEDINRDYQEALKQAGETISALLNHCDNKKEIKGPEDE